MWTCLPFVRAAVHKRQDLLAVQRSDARVELRRHDALVESVWQHRNRSANSSCGQQAGGHELGECFLHDKQPTERLVRGLLVWIA
jgi:hypothetical protein